MSSRLLMKREPGHVIYDGATFFSGADIEATIGEEVVEIQSSRFGKVDENVTGRMVTIKFTPLQFSAASLAKVYPFGALSMGSSILPATDKPIDIHTVSGKRYRIPCGFIYKEPASFWSVKKPILGEVEMRGVLGISADPGALASFMALSSTTYPGDTAWDLAEVLRPACAASWTQASGATAWDAIDTPDGWTLTPEASLTDDAPDGKGTINYVITNYKVKATAEPMNISGAELLAASGFGPLGASKSAGGRDLKINATGAFARLYNARLSGDLPLLFSAEKRHVGGLTWEAMTSFASGAKNPLFSVTTVDPDGE